MHVRGRISQICIFRSANATMFRDKCEHNAGKCERRGYAVIRFKSVQWRNAIFACHTHRFGNDQNRLNRISLSLRNIFGIYIFIYTHVCFLDKIMFFFQTCVSPSAVTFYVLLQKQLIEINVLLLIVRDENGGARVVSREMTIFWWLVFLN